MIILSPLSQEQMKMYYYSLNEYLKSTFGCKVYKLSLDGIMTCPNRDGTLGTRGCIFCGDEGSGEFASPCCGDINLQIEAAKKRVASKIKSGKYIAYFQSFTNTYSPVEHLKSIFYPAIMHPDIAALSIATRPDCLPNDVLELLGELNKIKPVWVELGLQTIHPKTADYIRRGYSLSCFDSAVESLKARNIQVIVHQILGLPDETAEMMYQTASYIGKSGADGIKLHLLYVLSGTDIEKDYKNGKFSLLSLDEYIKILEGCIMRLPKSMVIHRMTGDGAKAKLVAPQWSGNKKLVLNAIRTAFEKDNLQQGALFENTK